MRWPQGSFDYTSMEDRESIAAYLEALREGLARGEVLLAAGDRQLALHPGGLLQFRLTADTETGRTRLLMEVSWQEGAPPGRAEQKKLNIQPGGAE